MKDFLSSLYSNENFPIILGLFIIILVILFIIVYYWGRKDQKLIETRKLEKINLEEHNEPKERKESKPAFKETTKKEKVELKKEHHEEEKLELPKKVEVSMPKDVPEFDMPKRKVNNTFEYTRTIELPKLNEDSGVKTVSIEDFGLLAESIDKELKDLENINKPHHEDYNDEVDYLYEDTKEIELPKLRR